MASKVLVKIPMNFGSQVGKCTTADIISASVSARPTAPAENAVSSTLANSLSDLTISVSSEPELRVTQLEQNIKFLKEQHHLMLTSLHHEVETLRQRNRDLQFQLLFSKGSLALVKSTPSSPEDDSKPQVVHSPKQVNVTSLQVEILERDIAELKSSLNEVRGRNTCLENIIDEQKKQLEIAPKVSTSTDDVTLSPDPDLVFKLEEAEKIIRRLRRENDEQRRELAMIKATQSREQAGGGNPGAHQRQSNHWTLQQHHDHQREYHHDVHRDQREYRDQRSEAHHEQAENQQEITREASRFPPLNNQKFWHNNGGTQRGRWNHSWESSRGAGGSRMLNQSLPSLPGLPMGGNLSNTPVNASPSSAPFALLSHGGGRRMHRGNFRGERGGGRGSGQQGNRGHWDHNREHRGRDRDRNRDQQGYNE